MHAVAGERVEIDRERRDERLAFARPHLGDRAFVQHHAADELHVEMALAERALRRLAHRGEGRDQEIVERLAGGQLVAEALGPGAQRLIGEGFELLLQIVDALDQGSIGLEPPIIGRAEELLRQCAEHGGPFRLGGISLNAGAPRAAFLIARQRCQNHVLPQFAGGG